MDVWMYGWMELPAVDNGPISLRNSSFSKLIDMC